MKYDQSIKCPLYSICFVDLVEVQLDPKDWVATCWVHLIDFLYETSFDDGHILSATVFTLYINVLATHRLIFWV